MGQCSIIHSEFGDTHAVKFVIYAVNLVIYFFKDGSILIHGWLYIYKSN